MAEQSLGGFNVGLDQESVQMLEDVVQSSMMVAEHMEKAGVTSEKIADHLKAMEDTQKASLESLKTYAQISQGIVANVNNLQSAHRKNLEIQRDITNELKTQGVENKKQLTDTEQKAKQVSDMQGAAKKQGQQISKTVLSPLDSLSKSVLGKLPGWGQAAAIVGGAVAGKAAKGVTEIRDMARSGGEGFSDVGMSQAVQLKSAMMIATMSIPFLKESYASEASLQKGATQMYGEGGIRGSDLTAVMEQLPKLSYEIGMQFEDAANILVAMKRSAEGRGDDVSGDDLTAEFKHASTTAKHSGEKTETFMKHISNLFNGTKAFGGTMQNASIMLNLFVDEVKAGQTSYEALIKQHIQNISSGMDYVTSVKQLVTASDNLIENFTTMTDNIALTNKISETLSNRTKNYSDAQRKAAQDSGDYAAKIKDGSRDMGILNSAIENLTPMLSSFGVEGIKAFVDNLEGFARSHDMNAKLITSAGVDFSKTLFKITGDSERSHTMGSMIAMELGKELDNLTLSTSEVNDSIGKMITNFNLGPAAAVANVKTLKRLGETAGITTSSMMKYQAGLADGMREMFDKPGEAITRANSALASTARMLDEGMVSTGDYTKVMKTQMDVFGASGNEAVIQFNTLAKVVNGTSVRMSELATQVEQLSKVNKQFGIEQSVSTGMLIRFNEGLRNGSMTLGDMQSVLKGPGGTTPAIQNMLADELRNAGGFVGKMFEGVDPLGVTEMLPNIMRTLGGEDPTASMRLQYGDNTLGSARKMRADIEASGGNEGLSKQIGSSYKNLINRLIPGEGYNVNRLAQLRKMSSSIFGSEMDSYGKSFEDIAQMLLGDKDMGAFTKLLEESQKTVTKDDRVANNTKSMNKYLETIAKNSANWGKTGKAKEAATIVTVTETRSKLRKKSTLVGKSTPTTMEEKAIHAYNIRNGIEDNFK